MPELPEVETVKRTLQQKLAGLKFTDVRILLPKIVRTPDPGEFRKIITDKKITRIGRRGKYLQVCLSGAYTLIVHLRMTGRLVYCENDEPLPKYTHAVFSLDNGARLVFADMRQFGQMWLVPASSLDNLAGYKNLGIEPLDDLFTRDYLKKQIRRRHARIKPLLLDQTFIAGLGNIYADEVLHQARINPERLATTLTPKEIARLYHAIRDVLQESIKNRGTSVRDYVDGNGQPGNHQEHLQVYGQEDKPCPRCGEKIARKKVGGRSCFYCPSCQKY